MSQPTINIVGAGIGGLALGRCLLQRGIRAVLYEKAPSCPRHAYAITLQPSSYRPLLKALDIDEKVFKSRVSADAGIGGSGNINTEGYDYRSLEPSSFRAHRGRFEDLLKEGLDIRWDYTLEGVKTDGCPTLSFANGQSATSEFIIGADGPHSAIRKQLLPSAKLEILPYVAFNGKRRVSREKFDDLYASSFRETTVTEVRHGDIVLNISINEATEEQVSISWIYSRPSHGASDVLHKPNRPNAAAKDIPQEFFTEVEELKGLSQPFEEVFDVGKLREERILHWLMRHIIVSKDTLKHLGQKGILLMGDAAHAEQIIGGGGANGAIEDGVSLAEWIAVRSTSDPIDWYDERYARWQEGQEKSQTSIAGIHGQQDAGREKL